MSDPIHHQQRLATEALAASVRELAALAGCSIEHALALVAELVGDEIASEQFRGRR